MKARRKTTLLCAVLAFLFACSVFTGSAFADDSPEIVVHPTDKTVMNGQNAVFKVVAEGTNLTYKWYYSTAGSSSSYIVSGATTDTLTVTASAENSGRSYFCRVTGGSISVNSNSALLTTQYAVSFDANGGSGAPSGQKKTHGIALKLSTGKPTRTGYDFKGWALDEDSGTSDYASGASFTLDEDVTLYAVWERQTYTVQYDCLGGENGPDSQTKTYGTVLTLSMVRPTRTGYVFQGWSTSGAVASVSYEPGDPYREERSRTLYAVWEPKAVYTVTYDANGGSGAPAGQQKISENPLQLSETEPVREGYRFLGWAESKSALQAQYAPGATYQKDASVTLYAVWKEAGSASDFDVSRDAYAFNNSASSFGYTSRGPGEASYPIHYDPAFKLLFGNSVAGKSKYKSTVQSAWGGNCCGMSSTVALFYAGGMDPSAFGNSSVNNLQISGNNGQISLLTFIEAMQISQFTDAFAEQYRNNKLYRYQIEENGDRLNGLYQAVGNAADSHLGTIIGIGKTGVGGHALMAYGTESVSSTQDRLLIYDCNFPNQERSLYLTKDGNGGYSGWTYDMGSYGTWGITDENGSSCFISYIPYSTIQSIWSNRGHLYDNKEILTINGGNLSVLNMNGTEVARISGGHVSKSSSGVLEVPNLSMVWTGQTSVFLPRDYYTVVSNDGGALSLTMTDLEHSASVNTTADSVSFAVDSYTNENTVFIENASENDTYSVQLESGVSGVRYETISVNGTGKDGALSISGNDDTLSLLNCNISSLMINGEQRVTYVISAYAGAGGTITPAGDSIVCAGEDLAYTITPDPGYAVESVKLDGAVDMGCVGEYTFRNVNRNHMIVVQFARMDVGITQAAYDPQTAEVSVNFLCGGNAKLICAAYTSEGKMIRAVLRNISVGETETQFSLAGTQLPEGWKMKFMMVDAFWRPLCASREITGSR